MLLCCCSTGVYTQMKPTLVTPFKFECIVAIQPTNDR